VKLNAIEVVTLFVDDVAASKAFYALVFAAEEVFGDEAGAVLQFDGAMLNLLQAAHAPELVEPVLPGAAGNGPRVMFTVKVDDVDAECATLAAKGVALLNGPIDRPWGRRTAAFADPSGHVWEFAQEL
jgi:catechol 2,3-dioxygenase-like lactoylglutathione lyase family enzyme